jgi:hypothetical protein
MTTSETSAPISVAIARGRGSACVFNRRVLGTLGRWNRQNGTAVKVVLAVAVIAMTFGLLLRRCSRSRQPSSFVTIGGWTWRPECFRIPPGSI